MSGGLLTLACAKGKHNDLVLKLFRRTTEDTKLLPHLLERKCSVCIDLFLKTKEIPTTFLHYCLDKIFTIVTNQKLMCELIDKFPAELMIRNGLGKLPIHVAIEKQLNEVVQFMIQKDPKMMLEKDTKKQNLIEFAFRHNLMVLDVLIGAASLEMLKVTKWEMLLHCVVPSQCPAEILALLIDRIPAESAFSIHILLDYINFKDRYDVLEALIKINPKTLQKILDTEDLNRETTIAHYLLGRFSETRNSSLSGLLDNYSDVMDFSIGNWRGETPFDVAILSGQSLEVIKRLVSIDERVLLRKNPLDGNSVLHCIVKGYDKFLVKQEAIKIVRFLVKEMNVDLETPNKNGLIAFFYCLREWMNEENPTDRTTDQIVFLLELAPLKFSQESIVNFGIDRLALFLIDSGSKNTELVQYLTETIYKNPELNSKHAFIDEFKATFHPLIASLDRNLIIWSYFIHDAFEATPQDEIHRLRQRDVYNLFHVPLNLIHADAFTSDDKLKMFFRLLDELHRTGMCLRLEETFFRMFIPPVDDETTRRRFFDVLSTLLPTLQINLNDVAAYMFNKSTSIGLNTNYFALIFLFCSDSTYIFPPGQRVEKYLPFKDFLPAPILVKCLTNTDQVPDLMHLSRLKVREWLDMAAGNDSVKFLAALEALPVPPRIKTYLRYYSERLFLLDE